MQLFDLSIGTSIAWLPATTSRPPLEHVTIIDGKEDRQVLNVLDMRVRRAVNVRREAARSRKLIIDYSRPACQLPCSI
jgi:hypothetical protein